MEKGRGKRVVKGKGKKKKKEEGQSPTRNGPAEDDRAQLHDSKHQISDMMMRKHVGNYVYFSLFYSITFHLFLN